MDPAEWDAAPGLAGWVGGALHGAQDQPGGKPMIRYVLRDRGTQGCDFLLWGDDDKEAAEPSLCDALADGLDVELVRMPNDRMDPLTKRLIEGDEE